MSQKVVVTPNGKKVLLHEGILIRMSKMIGMTPEELFRVFPVVFGWEDEKVASLLGYDIECS